MQKHLGGIMENATPQKKAELQLELKKMYYETLELTDFAPLDIIYSRLKVLIESNEILGHIYQNALKDYKTQAETKEIRLQLVKIERLLSAFCKGRIKQGIKPQNISYNDVTHLKFSSLFPLIKPYKNDLLLPITQRDLYSFYLLGLEEYIKGVEGVDKNLLGRRYFKLLRWYLDLDMDFVNNLAFEIFSQDGVFEFRIFKKVEDIDFYFEYYKRVAISCINVLYGRLAKIELNTRPVRLENVLNETKGTEREKEIISNVLILGNEDVAAKNLKNIQAKSIRNVIDRFCLANDIEENGKAGREALKDWFIRKLLL
jgi:hypothetical protein